MTKILLTDIDNVQANLGRHLRPFDFRLIHTVTISSDEPELFGTGVTPESHPFTSTESPYNAYDIEIALHKTKRSLAKNGGLLGASGCTWYSKIMKHEFSL